MKIKYVIKFVQKKDHANDFLNGELFMRPAYYYRMLYEKNEKYKCNENHNGAQSDKKEGQVADGYCIYKNSSCLIYCTYIVYEENIYKGRITIPNKSIRMFVDTFGDRWLTLVKYEEYIEALKGGIESQDDDKTSYEMVWDEVKYGGQRNHLLHDRNDVNHLFIKNGEYRWQQEHRVILKRNIPPLLKKTIMPDGMWVKQYDQERNKNENFRIYKLSVKFRTAKIYQIEKLKHDEYGYYIDL